MATSNSSSNEQLVSAPEVESGDEFKVEVFSSSSELLSKLQKKCLGKLKPYPAMYSSIFGGIILDPAMMVIPIDDHMVHRGHGVFDTAIILDGYLYELDAHLARFLKSASKAKIVSPFSQPDLKSIIIQLTIASQCKTGTLRYWLSAGPGDFSLSPIGCPSSAFYAIVIDEDVSQCKEGVKVITSKIPMKAPIFAAMKSVNYLPNVLAKMEAEEEGAEGSIWVDDEGYVAEGPNVNVAFVTGEKELVLPLFDRVLSGCTALRLLELAPKLVGPGRLLPWKLKSLPVFSSSSPFYHTPSSPQPLTPDEEHDLKLAYQRLNKICERAVAANIPLLIDAEDTSIQPAIDYFSYSAAVAYPRGDHEPVIFNTIQAYLKDAKDRMVVAKEAADEMGVSLGFKLVRGAYMSSEKRLADELGVESPIHDSIQDTHACYDECADFLLDEIASGAGSVVLATHNVQSGKMAASKADKLGIPKNSPYLQFAQLYGMADGLSFGLKNDGFRVSKYLPFGPVEHIMPYLLRRAEENRGLMSTSTLDRDLMRKEIMRRLLSRSKDS